MLRNGSGMTAVGEIGSSRTGESDGVSGKAEFWKGSLKGKSRVLRELFSVLDGDARRAVRLDRLLIRD